MLTVITIRNRHFTSSIPNSNVFQTINKNFEAYAQNICLSNDFYTIAHVQLISCELWFRSRMLGCKREKCVWLFYSLQYYLNCFIWSISGGIFVSFKFKYTSIITKLPTDLYKHRKYFIYIQLIVTIDISALSANSEKYPKMLLCAMSSMYIISNSISGRKLCQMT